MRLLLRVAEILEEAGIEYVVIGASAMAVHGISRSTLDIDLLTIDHRALQQEIWLPLVEERAKVVVRFGDVQDPLRGVVQIESAGQRPIDLIVGHGGWQAGVFARAIQGIIAGIELPVADKVGLILLKLYAGGPQDRWDVQQLLSTDPSDGLQERVERVLKNLPRGMRDSWLKIVDG